MSNYDRIKAECYEANLLLPEFKLIDLTFGNVSVADPDEGVFAIKPSGVDYTQLSESDIVVIDLEGNVVEGALRPSSDTPTHRRLFQAFAGIRSIVHTHSRNAVAFAQAGRGIPCLGTTHADYFHGPIPVTQALTPKQIRDDYEVNTGNAIVRRFARLNPLHMPGVLVAGHAPFCWGATPAEAAHAAVIIEEIAAMATATVTANPKAKAISKRLHDKHFLRKHGASAYYWQKK